MWREFIIICEHVALYHVRLVSREAKSPPGPALAHGVIVAHDWRQLGLAPAAAAGQCHASHFGTTALLLCCQSRLKLPQAHVRRTPLVDATPVLGHDGQACKNLFERVAQLDERAKGDPLLQNSFIPGFVSTEGELDYSFIPGFVSTEGELDYGHHRHSESHQYAIQNTISVPSDGHQ